MGASATGMHHAFGNAFTVKTLEFLDQLHVLQQHRPGRASGLRVLVVADGGTVIAGQRRSIDGEGQQAGGQNAKGTREGKAPRPRGVVMEVSSDFIRRIQVRPSEASDPKAKNINRNPVPSR